MRLALGNDTVIEKYFDIDDADLYANDRSKQIKFLECVPDKEKK